MLMKAQWIALLASLAAGTALAQSSVTMYGIADAGLGKAKVDGDSRVHMISGSTMNNVTSRIGVRGVEDLGGGWEVGFNFESGLSLGDGSTASEEPRLGRTVNTFWNRQATVSLGGPWGTLTMGRLWTPADYAYDMWDLTGLANYSVVENMFMDVGADFNDRSEFRYSSPAFGGLNVELAYVFKDDHKELDGTPDGRAKWDLALLYAHGPISASLDVNKLKGNKANYALGGKYEFGRFAVAASYTDARAMELYPDPALGAAPGTYVHRRGVTLGGSVNLGAVDLTLDLGRDLRRTFDDRKYTNGVFEAKYHLSKRTLAYAAYLRMDGTNNYGAGLRHDF